MAIRIIHHNGDNSDGLTWGTAYTSWVSYVAAESPGAGDIAIFGHDHIDQNTYAANYTLQGPTTTGPLILISCTQGTGSVAGGLSSFAYQKATSLRQIDTSNNGANAYTLSPAGILSLYGVSLRSGGRMTTFIQTGFHHVYHDVTLGIGPNWDLLLGDSVGYLYCRNLTIDLTLDGTTNRTTTVISSARGQAKIEGLSFINPAYRTGSIILAGNLTTDWEVSGANFDGFVNATTPSIINPSIASGVLRLSHSKTAATYTFLGATDTWRGGRIEITNVGPANQPTQHLSVNMFGRLENTTSVYRTGGAEVEGTNISWGGPTLGIETKAACSVDSPFYTPWIHLNIPATGTYEIAMFIGNNTADLTDNEAWIEVEYKDDASSGEWTLATDKADRTATPAAQTDDTTSTWNGDTLTYMQKLHVSGLTVGTTGLGRARVGVGVASIAAARDFYIDPKVIVT